MKLVLRNLMLVCLLLGGCVSIRDTSKHILYESHEKLLADEDILLWSPCDPTQAQLWAEEAEKGNGRAALKAAHCYLVLIVQSDDASVQLEYAMRGRGFAEAAAASFPKNGAAHYLIAYLTGLEAERDPMRGLTLVPYIESEAQLAAELRPELDRGGPDRMLGELYLHAPGFPFSVGDYQKAIIHFKRALEYSPDFFPNRYGLVKALLSEGDFTEGCREMDALVARTPCTGDAASPWCDAIEDLKAECAAPPGD